MCMCVCARALIYLVASEARAFVQKEVVMSTYMCACMCVRVYMCVQLCVCVCVRTLNSLAASGVRAFVQKDVFGIVYVCVCVFVCAFVCVCVCVHVCTDTSLQVRFEPLCKRRCLVSR